MSTTPTSPYEGFNFLVAIEGIPVVSFAECTLPSVSIDVLEYREGFESANNTHDVPGLVKFGDLTLKRGLANSASVTAIWDWFNSFIQGKGVRHDITVSLMDAKSLPAISWTFADCWPVKYESPVLNARTSSIAIETLVVSVDGVTVANKAVEGT